MNSPKDPPSGSMEILIIDDDRELCGLIAEYLRPFGYGVEMAHEGRAGVEAATARRWTAVILDVMLPGMDGFEVLKAIRAKSDVPLLMLTSRGDETDRIVGLELGADDYLPKTFSSRELLARLRAVTRRKLSPAKPATSVGARAADEPEIIRAGPLEILCGPREVLLRDEPVKLTALEFDLLTSLARHPGRVKTREQLLDHLAQREYDGMDRSIDVHIWALRKKLGDDPRHPYFIKTVRSYGYMFLPPQEGEGL